MILATTVRTQREHKRVVVHLLNDASSWGRHSLYQHIAEQPNELRDPKHPLNPEMRGTWPVREETIPIHSVKVTCRVPGVKSAKLQPEDLALALKPVAGGVEVTVPVVELHSMVVFEA